MSRDVSLVTCAVRTFAAAIVGGTVGAVVLGAVVGSLVADGGGLATLRAVIVAAGVGALLGVSLAMAVELRDEPVRLRGVTILTVLLLGPVLCALVAWESLRPRSSATSTPATSSSSGSASSSPSRRWWVAGSRRGRAPVRRGARMSTGGAVG